MGNVLVDVLGCRAARMAIASGDSPLAFALEMSDSAPESLILMPAASSMSDFSLSRREMIFLLCVSNDPGDPARTHQSS